MTVPFRILSLLLCLLVAGPMNALPTVAPGCGDAQVLEEQSTAGGTPTVRYAFGFDLISQDRNGTVHYFGYDGPGTVRYLTTTANPPVVSDTYTYDAFGIQIASSGAGTANTYRYAGEQWDEHLGMYYLRARYYHPEVGRFWTMDTFEGTQSDPLSLHKYLYCHGDPVNFTDPSGQWEGGVFGSLVSGFVHGMMRGMRTITTVGAGQIARMSLFGKIGLPATAAIIAGLYGFDEFSGDPPDQNQQQKIDRALTMIRADGFGHHADRGEQIRYRVIDDLVMSSKEAYGYTPFFAVRVIWLDSGTFSWEDVPFASLLIHEIEHSLHYTRGSERGSYQIQSDFLWTEAVTGRAADLAQEYPNTAYDFFDTVAGYMRNLGIKHPAITQ